MNAPLGINDNQTLCHALGHLRTCEAAKNVVVGQKFEAVRGSKVAAKKREHPNIIFREGLVSWTSSELKPHWSKLVCTDVDPKCMPVNARRFGCNST
ncbi:hypothetical protein GCM10008941_06420 [Rhizomicrobium palustre]